MLSVCLDVNQGGTNRNRCTQRLVNLYAQHRLMNSDHTPELGPSDLLYGSKLPAEKWMRVGVFKSAEPIDL